MANVVNELRTMILKLNLAADRDNFIIHLGENDSYALAMFWYQKEYGTVDVEDGDEGLEEYIAKKEYESLTTFKGIKLKWNIKGRLFQGKTFVENIKHNMVEVDMSEYDPKKDYSKGDNTMNFQNTVQAMKLGNKVRRLSWPEGHHITRILQRPEIQVGSDKTDAIEYFDWKPKFEDFDSNDWWVVV